MAGIIGIALTIILIIIIIIAAEAEVVIITAIVLAAVKITTVKHLTLNLFQAQINLPIQQLLKGQGDKIIVEIVV